MKLGHQVYISGKPLYPQFPEMSHVEMKEVSCVEMEFLSGSYPLVGSCSIGLVCFAHTLVWTGRSVPSALGTLCRVSGGSTDRGLSSWCTFCFSLC